MTTEKRWIAFCTDEDLPASTAIFVVSASDKEQAQEQMNQSYQQFFHQVPTIRLIEIEEEAVQFIGYPISNEDAQAILALSQEVLALAAGEPSITYADKLRALIRSFSLGRYAYNAYYAVKKGSPFDTERT